MARKTSTGVLALAGCCLAVALLSAAGAGAASRRDLWYRIPQDSVERFSFEATRTVATVFSTMPEEAASFDLAPLQERLARVETTIEGSIERMVARVFRDGSLGLVTRLVDLRGSIGRGGAPSPLDLVGLQGKSVAFRILPSGELLDSFGWGHLAGAGRGGDHVTDVLLQPILRLPASIPGPGQAMPATFQVRIPVEEVLERRQQWSIVWTAAQPEPSCRGCVALDYEGGVVEDSADRHPARPMDLHGVGKVSGRVVLGRGSGQRSLVAHAWAITWERTVRSTRDDGSVRGEIGQQVVASGRVWKEGR